MTRGRAWVGAVALVLGAAARAQDAAQGSGGEPSDGSAQQPTAVAAAPSVPRPPPATAPPSGRTGPHREETPEERAARALERTLVERGGLLLPPGRFEIVPEVSYAHSEQGHILAPDGKLLDAASRVVTGAVTLRLGLPARLQVEGELPYVYALQTVERSDGARASASGTGLGDIRLSATWHVVRGRERFPDVLLSGFWKSKTGRSPLDPEPTEVPFGSGFEQFGGGLSLVKAVDPVVLLASVMVAESVPRQIGAGWLDPRAQLGINTSAILAVSPETSLSFGLEQLYGQQVYLARKPIPGSDRTGAVFNVGLSTLLSRYGFLEVTLGMGLTADVPRFQVTVAAPLQF